MAVSLSKLDLSFLRKNVPAACQPGRYRFDADEGVVPAGYHARKHRPVDRRSDLPTPYFVPDVDAAYGGEWKSIIDGSTISSRSNWREHNKRHGVVDVGDKFWAEDGDDARHNREIMGYDPSLIGKQDDGDGISFNWNRPAANPQS